MGNKISDRPPQSKLVLFAYLMAATIVATAAMSPALLFLLDPTRPEPLFGASGDPVSFIAGFAVGNLVLAAIAIAFGLRLEPAVRVGLPLLPSWPGADQIARATVLRCAAIAVGLAAGVLACGVAFRSQLPELPAGFVFPPVWQGILMMLGAAVREEILFRFFALNLLVWLVMKAAGRQEPTVAIAWASNAFVALVFAVLHLVPAAQFLALNALAGSIAIAIGVVAGVVFGWVYWRYGLLMAMFTHAVGGLLVYLGARGTIVLLQ